MKTTVKGEQRRARHVPPERKSEMLNRLRSARGHLDAVIRMVEDEAYCVDVIKQISAIRAALDRVGRMELRNHFEHCFAEAIRTGEDDRVIGELMDALAFNKELL
ncbi:MAG TPA: metal-sensitive transcriptional regulator [Candidatus Dormibacteraeota bacterium]|nr:metal-sensitive transcriptional regulator [Candidatus Dormibacteraeota bacterium]